MFLLQSTSTSTYQRRNYKSARDRTVKENRQPSKVSVCLALELFALVQVVPGIYHYRTYTLSKQEIRGQ